MDPLYNPFAPGADTQPPELAGREEIIDRTRLLLNRVTRGRQEKSFIVVGLRGVGKTVVLNQARDVAEEIGLSPVQVEAVEDRNLIQLLVPRLQQTLLRLDRVVSRKLWKFPSGVLRACEGSVFQAARSRGIGSRG